ncbi:MAG: hypothetical protein PHQ62_04230 [Clostridia bacterium]|nr:hypothetical protein [Clostridia bacterium]
MKIKISKNLLEFAQTVNKFGILYIVGGYIRNSLLGFTETDIDLTSRISPEKMANILKNTKFEVIEKSTKLGTIKIKCGDEIWEHTTFRRDNYYRGGTHKVKSVDYVEDLRQDAQRRDFTINTIYYDILQEKIIDIYSGLLDLKNGVIRCVEVPSFVFAHDGLRILRMIRLACELNFKIDSTTFATAKKLGHQLNDISGYRKFLELNTILNSSKRYIVSKKNAHIKGLTYFNELKLWNSFFVTTSRVRLKMSKKVSIENAFFGLLIDIIDTINPDCIEYYIKYLLGKDAFGQPTNVINHTNMVICGYYDALNKMNNKKYFFKYFNYFDKIGEILSQKSTALYSKYKFFYSYIKKHKLPISLKELKIDGNDLKENIPALSPKKYNIVLINLLSKVFDAEVANEKDDLIKEVINDFRNDNY